jgi:hypothetical protein
MALEECSVLKKDIRPMVPGPSDYVSYFVLPTRNALAWCGFIDMGDKTEGNNMVCALE